MDLKDENLNNYKLIRIYPINNHQLSELKKIEDIFGIKSLNINKNDLSPAFVKTNTSDEELMKHLNSSDIKFEIVNKDLQKLIDEHKLLDKSYEENEFDFSYTYYNYVDIIKHLRYFRNKNFNLSQVFSIGKSTENRKIVAIILNNRSYKTSKKKVIIECGIHAREWISTATCLWISNQLVNNFIDKKLLDIYEFVIIPSLNPDGYEYTWTTDRLWRKTRSKSKHSECIGTDLNRNWNSSWCTSGASPDPCNHKYCGDSPFSEPEIKSLKKFLKRNKKSILAYFSLHSYSQLWLYPLGYKRQSKNKRLDNLSKFATNEIFKIHNQIYKYGSIASIINLTSGSSVDWVYEKLKVKLCFAIELRDNGFYGFLLPPELIRPSAEEIWAGIKAVIQSI